MATTNASNQDQDAVVQALCKRVDELTDQNKSMHDSITRLQSQNHSQPSVGPVNQATNPPYDVGYAYAPPWTIHFYRGGNDSASGSQGLAPGPPHKEAVANQPTSSDANSAALNTTVNANDELVKTGPEAIGASKDNNVPQQTPSHGLRRLPTIDEEIEPWLVPGPLTNPVTNYPLFMTIRAVPKAFHGHFNFGHQGPAEEVSGHWEFFSEGPESAEALAHTNLGGQGNWTPNDIVRPTADDVHELRQRLRAERKDDITANIHLTWVTDQTLSKEDRDKLRNRYASQGQKVHGTVHGRTSVVSDKPDTASGKPDTVNKESHAGSKHDGAKKLREDTRWQEELITEENTKDAGTNVSEKNVIPQGDKPLSRPVTRAQSAPSIDTSKIKRAESVARPSTQTHPTEKKRPSTSKAKRPPKPPGELCPCITLANLTIDTSITVELTR